MPLAVDPAHPFPYISGLSLNLASACATPKTGKEQFARLKVPQMLPRFVQLAAMTSVDQLRFIPLEDLIANHLDELFPGMEVLEHHTFRVTRNEDVEVEEDETENLLQALEKELLRRRFGPPIRLEVTDDMDDVTLDLLVRELDITEQEVYRLPAPLDLGGLFELAKHRPPRPARTRTHVPTTAPQLHADASRTRSPTSSPRSRSGDILLHHPYDSFATSVQAFLEQAAADPHVLAIKQTLYRTSRRQPDRRSPHRRGRGRQAGARPRRDQGALRRAGQHLLGAQAREGRRARRLRPRRPQDALQARARRPAGERRAASTTATSAPATTTRRRAASTRTSACSPPTTRSARTSPGCSTSSPATRSRRSSSGCWSPRCTCARACSSASRPRRRTPRAGKPSRHPHQGQLDRRRGDHRRAVPREQGRRAGRPRGARHLRAQPGVEGLSENIRVRCILGRFLEHSRIFSFVNDGDPQVFIGSADMMHRNLDRRVEALVRLTDPDAPRRARRAVQSRDVDERTSSWWLGPEASGRGTTSTTTANPLDDIQNVLMQQIAAPARARGRVR